MNNKKGFVLIETVIVLIVVLITLIGLYNGYSSIFSNLESKRYYDTAKDLYKLNLLKDYVDCNITETVKLYTSDDEVNNYLNEMIKDEQEDSYELSYENDAVFIVDLNKTDENDKKAYITDENLYNSDIQYLATIKDKTKKYIVLRSGLDSAKGEKYKKYASIACPTE